MSLWSLNSVNCARRVASVFVRNSSRHRQYSSSSGIPLGADEKMTKISMYILQDVKENEEVN